MSCLKGLGHAFAAHRDAVGVGDGVEDDGLAACQRRNESGGEVAV